jgi:hypothetical protein
LQKDLALVPTDKLIILCLHIPVHNSVKNNTDLYAILGDRKVHIMSGHTHYHRNVIKGNIFEHNHGTVCGPLWQKVYDNQGTFGHIENTKKVFGLKGVIIVTRSGKINL